MSFLKDFKIMGLSLPMYAVVLAVLIIAMALGVLPGGMIGAFLFMMVVGALLDTIGNNLPIIKTYFGGGPIVIIFGSSALVYFNLIPESVTQNVDTFMKGGGFLDFYIAALIVGSILGMSKTLLVKAAVRYLPCILGATAVALLLVALGGMLFGQSPGESIAYIGIPIMGGGMGAGAVPISQVFGKALNIDSSIILSRLVPAVALGNAMAIISGGLLDRLGKKYPSLTGNGKLMDVGDDEELMDKESEAPPTLQDYGIGIAVSTGFFALGQIIANLVDRTGFELHPYAYMIIAVALVKSFNLLPASVERSCSHWYKFVTANWTPALLMGIGIAYTDLGQIISAFTPVYLVLCALVVLGSMIGGGLVGKLVGFYPIEAAITAGLCMANMGGTGDVAVLTAANRMELMPFAQISSRLGGAFIILLATVLVPIVF